MSVKSLRYRPNGTALGTLDLTAAAAADRRVEIPLGQRGADANGTRLLGFAWSKTTGQAVTVTVSLIDTADSDREYVLEGPTNDGGALTGTWRPNAGEEMAGGDPESPGTSGWTYRLQFSQAAGACAASVIAVMKEV